MPNYITDTHALVWYLSGSAELSPSARNSFDESMQGSSQVLVPAIVLAEIVMMVEKRRVNIDTYNVVSALQSAPHFILSSLTPTIALRIQSLSTLPGIHDRLIVAEALENGADLITYDRAITDSGLVTTIW